MKTSLYTLSQKTYTVHVPRLLWYMGPMKVIVFAVLMFPKQADLVVTQLLKKGMTVTPWVRLDDGSDVPVEEPPTGSASCQMIVIVEREQEDGFVVTINDALASVKHYGAYYYEAGVRRKSWRVNGTVVLEKAPVSILPSGPYRTPA